MRLTVLPRYDPRQTYDWNYTHAPAAVPHDEPQVTGSWDFCGLPVRSPLGIAAGPLLNGEWILYYAALGFDVLTYKTVRSRHRDSYARPNLQPVESGRLVGSGPPLRAGQKMRGSWAVSFGMPSKSPDVWRADIERTRRVLAKHKLLSVSVVATPEPYWSADDLAEDFARCARWAVESGADAVEANFSCPNVASADAQLYQQPETAGCVAARLRAAVGATPLLIKIGHVPEEAEAAALAAAVSAHVNALVMVHCISAHIADAQQRPIFEGQSPGIAGHAIREPALEQIALFARVIRHRRLKLKLVGVGGISTAAHVRAHLEAGGHAVQLATAAMLDPRVGLTIRAALAETA